jgi:AAA+ superfamily predicted ATPase
MLTNLTTLIDKHFKGTIVNRDYERFELSMKKIKDHLISEEEFNDIFKTINDQIEFFKLNLDISALTLSNLFSYMYDAKQGGNCEACSGTRRRITRELYKRLSSDKNHFIQIDDLDVPGPEPEPVKRVIAFSENQLSKLIGQQQIKDEILGLTALAKVRKLKELQGIPTSPSSLHMVFYGNPGTGKTTVARLIGAIYKDLGLLAKGHIVEKSRADLVDKFIGGTGKNVLDAFKEAEGGVLFIDEAYALFKTDSDKDFGREAIDTIVKLMEDKRDSLVVVLAGYRKEMEKLLDSNPGLRSRFSTFISFPDFEFQELLSIFIKSVADVDHFLTAGAQLKLELLFEDMFNKNQFNGNARDVRNIFEKTMVKQALRLNEIQTPTAIQLREIQPDDLPDLEA